MIVNVEIATVLDNLDCLYLRGMPLKELDYLDNITGL